MTRIYHFDFRQTRGNLIPCTTYQYSCCLHCMRFLGSEILVSRWTGICPLMRWYISPVDTSTFDAKSSLCCDSMALHLQMIFSCSLFDIRLMQIESCPILRQTQRPCFTTRKGFYIVCDVNHVPNNSSAGEFHFPVTTPMYRRVF